MGHKVRIIIPSDNEVAISPIIGRIIGRWGGCTVTSAYGWWSPDKGEPPVRDKLSVVDTSIGEWNGVIRHWWMDLADVIRREWKQTTVFLSVTGETAFLVSDLPTRVIGQEEPLDD